MQKTLGVGVVGLGDRWQQKYKPALLSLQGRFRIVGVTDQVRQVTRREAKALQCAEAGGVVPLVEDPGIDVLLLADAQWYGLWPLEAAAAAGKPVFCGASPGVDPENVGRLAQEQGQTPVMVDLASRCLPAVAWLVELCRSRIGPPSVVNCSLTRPGSEGEGGTPTLDELFSLHVLDLCAALLDGDPLRVLAGGSRDGSLANLLLEFPDGRAAQVTSCRAPRPRESCRLQVIGTRGVALAELPRRVSWADAGGSWARRLPAPKSPCRELLARFHRAVLQGKPGPPSLAEAYRVWRWQAEAARSWREGRWVVLEQGPPPC